MGEKGWIEMESEKDQITRLNIIITKLWEILSFHCSERALAWYRREIDQ